MTAVARIYRWELAKLLAQKRTYLGLGAAAIVPVIDSTMMAHLLAVHAQGVLLGNHDDAFSSVGDSITATGTFLVALGNRAYDPGNPALVGSHADLGATIAFFRTRIVDGFGSNSFTHGSYAAYPGWRTADVLAFAGTAPLVFEFNATHPAIALIMIGTNDVLQMVDPQVFRVNLTRIVDTAMSMGVIPVLSTIPDNARVNGVYEPRWHH